MNHTIIGDFEKREVEGLDPGLIIGRFKARSLETKLKVGAVGAFQK